MKHFLVFIALSLATISCSVNKGSSASTISTADPTATSQMGTSFETAVVIHEKSELTGVDAEYQWLADHYPGYKTVEQKLVYEKGKPYDIITIKTKNGEQTEVYFDISKFFGKF